jgi:O-antigen/teichoic acid export membrane protein
VNAPTPRGALVVRDSTVALVSRLAAICLSLLLAVGLLRLLGESLYGAWSLLAVVLTATSVLDFGLPGAVERQVAESAARGEPARAGDCVTSALWLIIGAVVIAEAGLLAWRPSASGLTGNAWAAAIYVPPAFGVALVSLVFGAALTGLKRFTAFHGWRLAGLVVSTAATLWLAAADITRLELLVVAYASGSVVALLGCWLSLRQAWPEMTYGRPQRTALSALLNVGGALQAASLAPLLADYAFRVLVATRFGAASAGIYDIAARVAIVVRSLAGAITSAIVPHSVALLDAADAERVGRLHRSSVGALALLAMPATALVLGLAGGIGNALAGPAHAVDLQQAIVYLLLAHLLASMSLPGLMVARAARRPWPEAAAAVFGAVAGLAGAAIWLSLPLAAAWLWATHTAALGCAWWWISRRLPVWDIDVGHLARVGASSALALLVGAALHYALAGFWGLVAGVTAGTATFVALVAIADLVPLELRRAFKTLSA